MRISKRKRATYEDKDKRGCIYCEGHFYNRKVGWFGYFSETKTKAKLNSYGSHKTTKNTWDLKQFKQYVKRQNVPSGTVFELDWGRIILKKN